MTLKRIILSILTVVVLLLVGGSLVESWNEPQVQSRLELYQTNLILHAAEWQGETFPGTNVETAKQTLIGDDAFANALKQYQEASESTKKTVNNTASQLQKLVEMPIEEITPATEKKLQIQRQNQQNLLAEIELHLGILQLQQNQTETAVKTWANIISNAENITSQSVVNTAQVLVQLTQSQVLPDAEKILDKNLDGWFRYRALSQLYQVQEKSAKLEILQAQEQVIAEQSVVKLGIVGAIPTLGFLVGTGLLIVLLVQRFLKGKEAVLAKNGELVWDTPWDWEIIWQVFIVGFFLVGQLVVPFLLQFLNALLKINPAGLDVRAKAIYILVSYLLLAGGGLLAIYLSIKPFLPLPEGWFSFQGSKWFFWGLGGYLVALPLVVLVSLINQKIWQGQGGSNPILPIALDSKDSVALSVFFLTASIGAPVFEEIMFRGFLLPSLTRYMPVWGAIVISSVLFAVAHLNVSEILPLVTLGLVLGFIYSRSRNLLSSMLLHSLWNSGTLLSLYILGSGTN